MEGYGLIYTQDMRAALHGIDNPTSLPVDVAQRDDMLYLLVDLEGYRKLEPRQRRDFRSYLHALVRTIEIGGGKVQVSKLDA